MLCERFVVKAPEEVIFFFQQQASVSATCALSSTPVLFHAKMNYLLTFCGNNHSLK